MTLIPHRHHHPRLSSQVGKDIILPNNLIIWRRQQLDNHHHSFSIIKLSVKKTNRHCHCRCRLSMKLRFSFAFFFHWISRLILGRQKVDEQTFDFPSRRSYSRERTSNASVTSNELNGNGVRSSNHPSQRRLHSISSYPHEQPSLSQTHLNENDHDRLEQDFVRDIFSSRRKKNLFLCILFVAIIEWSRKTFVIFTWSILLGLE